jgi:hypothetical protein
MAMPTIRLEMDLQDLGRPQPDAQPEQPSLIPAESPGGGVLAADRPASGRPGGGVDAGPRRRARVKGRRRRSRRDAKRP